MGYKTTPLSRSERHRMTFPAINLTQQAGSPVHTRAIENIITRCREQNREIAYAASWTIDPQFRHDRSSTIDLRGIFEALYVFGHRDYGIAEVIAGGTIRFKTNALITKLGHQPLVSEYQQELPPIRVRHLFEEDVLVMHLREFTAYADQCCSKFQSLWDNRIEISPESNVKSIDKLSA